MEHDFGAYVDYFKNNLKELKMCGDKVVELSAPTKATLAAFRQKVDAADKQIGSLFGGFMLDEKSISMEQIEKQILAARALKQKCELFSIDALGGQDKSEIGLLRTNVSKLNLLLEASMRIKVTTDARVPKVVEKFPDADMKMLDKIVQAIAVVAITINKEVSALNAQIGFVLAKEIELTSRIATFDAIVAQLQKRFAAV